MRKLILTAALAVLAGPALAADMTVGAPVAAPVALYNWSGLYVGGNVGYGWNNVETTKNSVTTQGDIFGIGNVLPSATYAGADSSSGLDGMLGGAQIGYGWQFGNIYAGVEADFQAADFKTNSAFLGSPAGPGYQTSSKIDMLWTARGRLGYAIDNVLLYGTAGVAGANVRSTVAVQGGTFAAPIGPAFSAASESWQIGYAVGAGVEWAFAKNWSAKAEYLRVGLGNRGYDFQLSPTSSAHADAKVDLDIFRVGVNYRFN